MITVQPLSVTVNGGGTVAFTVTATSANPPTYQWTKNGTNISGATSDTLILSSVGTHAAATGRHGFQAEVEVKLGRMAAVTGQVTRLIRSANLWNLFRRTAEMAMKAAEYKATRRASKLALANDRF